MSRKDWKRKCEEVAVLLLEGNDDCNIVNKFCKDNTIEKNFDFRNCGSDNQVLAELYALLLKDEDEAPKIKIIGVILDADDKDIDSRYKEIKGKVKNFYKKLPKKIPENGLVHSEGKQPRLGVWIMPNNKDNGALEEFYLELADIDTDFIDKTIQQAEEKNLTSFKPQHRNKAIMHTCFAWQNKPGMPLHAAINEITLDNNADIARDFKGWLVKLFS